MSAPWQRSWLKSKNNPLIFVRDVLGATPEPWQAEALQALDVRSEQPVAILLDQGAAFIGALLGVLKAGGCFVPLDPDNPPGRNLQMLVDSGARVLMGGWENHTRRVRLLFVFFCPIVILTRPSG